MTVLCVQRRKAVGAGATLLAHTAKKGNGGSFASTDAIDTTNASLLVIAASFNTSPGTVTISDSKTGNTWTGLTTAHGSNDDRIQFYVCTNPAQVGSGHTATFSSTATAYPSLTFAAFGGTVLSQTADINGAVSGSGTIALGSQTPAHDNELILSALSWDDYNGGANQNSVISVDSGMTILDTIEYDGTGTLAYGVSLAWKTQTTAAAINPSWTASHSPFVGATAMASFTTV